MPQPDPFAADFQPTDHAAAQMAQQQGGQPQADGMPNPNYGFGDPMPPQAPPQAPPQQQQGYPQQGYPQQYPQIPGQPQQPPQQPQYAPQQQGYSGLSQEDMNRLGLASEGDLWGVPVGNPDPNPGAQPYGQQAAPQGPQMGHQQPHQGAPSPAMDPQAYLQQQYAQLHQQMEAITRSLQGGYAPAGQPQGDGQQGAPPVPAQQQQAPAEPELKRPTKPEKPEDFDPYEAQTDPKSASAKYLAAQAKYVEDLADYADKKSEAEAQKAQRMQEEAARMQRQAHMEQALIARAQREYGLSPAEAAEFLRYATGPGLNDMAGWVQAFRYSQAQAARQQGASQYPQNPQAQPTNPAQPPRDPATGQFLPRQQAPMVPQQYAPQQQAGYPVVPQHAAGAPAQPYAQPGFQPQMPNVNPFGQTGFPPTVASQASQYVPAASVEDQIFNQMLGAQNAMNAY